MTRTTIIALAASLTTLATAPAFADTLSIKPLQGASFAIGADHAVSYFTSENGRCNLVVARAGEPDWNNGASLSVARYEAAIGAGKTAQYDGSIAFTCAADAQSILIKRDTQVAETGAK